MAFVVVALVLRVLNLDGLLSRLDGPRWWAEVIWWNVLTPPGVLAFATLGAMILAREAGNRPGWLAISLATLPLLHELSWQ